MRSHFFCDQDRQLICNIVFLRSYISRSIRSDCKFTHWKCWMMEQDIIFNIFFILFFIFKIPAGIGYNFSIFKFKLQITELKTFQIYLAYVKKTVCSGKDRGSKHFANGNIYIRYTVLEIGLLRRVCKSVQMYPEICFIRSFSLYRYPFCGIQSIDKGLLDFLVKLVIQGVDFHDLAENLLIITADLRNRICNNGKASLITFNVAVCNLSSFILHLNFQLLLSITELPCLFYTHR